MQRIFCCPSEERQLTDTMKFSTRLKYIFATLLMGAVVVFDHVWGGWLPDDYPYAVWIHYGLLVPVGFCLAVSLGMNTGNPGVAFSPSPAALRRRCCSPYCPASGWL